MGQHATSIEVKFRPGSPSTLSEKVASGLVLRFDTIDYINDNLAYFENGFDDSGSFLDVGRHYFYIAITKPFPEEVTDVFGPLGDAGSSCSKSSNLGAMCHRGETTYATGWLKWGPTVHWWIREREGSVETEHRTHC
jgi:hypothetical protein